MKRFILIAAMLFAFGSIATAQTAAQQIVAVYVTGDADNNIKKVIGSKLVSGITRSEGYTAVERTADFLAGLTKEQDFQMSGAVSDSQIARLGAYFGVNYVLVADMSEVFGQSFVSARMIDVQTAQITNSTEESAVVNDMESLTKLSETIVLKLFYVTYFAVDDIKILGPFSDAKSLRDVSVPAGYHIASKEEAERIIRNNQILKRNTNLPIFTDIKKDWSDKTQYFTVKYYANNSTYKVKDTESKEIEYTQYNISYTIIYGVNNSSTRSSYYITNGTWGSFEYYYNRYNYPATSSQWGCATEGLKDIRCNQTITAGYVYLIKDKENKKEGE